MVYYDQLLGGSNSKETAHKVGDTGSIPGLGRSPGERFYEDLQDLLELTPKQDVLFIIGDWNAKVGSQKHLE